jgi:hypothetical protein
MPEKEREWGKRWEWGEDGKMGKIAMTCFP